MPDARQPPNMQSKPVSLIATIAPAALLGVLIGLDLIGFVAPLLLARVVWVVWADSHPVIGKASNMTF